MKDIQIHDIPYDRPEYITKINPAKNSWHIPFADKTKSKLEVGNLTKHFNRFHRLMWRLCFGIKIEIVKEESK